MYFKALQSLYRAFIPPAGIARARCPPEFAYVFRALIAERYRGGDRSAGRPAIWLRPIPAHGRDGEAAPGIRPSADWQPRVPDRQYQPGADIYAGGLGVS